ncbi:MAG: hypothetical protein NC041_07655 [Bacteroides sp.]|nr:hypothetical protein [Prevotella sp.]MCM1407175.1 hypothetical protein [Treponema brennaborense]MCM1470327.1 hypothetical protein [Bacteroides sp.]
MKHRFFYFFIPACMYLLNNVSAQNFPQDYVSRKWKAADGLPGNSITDIIQNRQGYIYIGTYNNFVKFDGIRFAEVSADNDADGRRFSARCIFEDSRGIIWIGTNDEGLAKLQNNTAAVYTTENGLPNNSVRDIIEDARGNIWIGTASGAAYLTPDGTFAYPSGLAEYGEEKASVSFLYCDSGGIVWLGTTNHGGLYRFAADAFEKFGGLEQYADFEITAMNQDASGAFWFGVSGCGALKYDNGSLRLFNQPPPLRDSAVNDIVRDKTDSLWFGTTKGVALLKNGKFSSYTEQQGLANNNVKRILEDSEGNIWLATDRGGIERLNPGKFRTMHTAGAVNCITEDTEKRVWIGTDSGLVCREKSAAAENILTQECSGRRVRDVFAAADGTILVSMYGAPGLLLFDGARVRSWSAKDGLAGDNIRTALKSSCGTIYAGSITGLSIIKNNAVAKNITHANGFDNDFITCICETNGDIWIGTDGAGVYVLRNDEIVSHFTTQNGLAGNVIFHIAQDYFGTIWICTGTGISRYDNASFFTYSASCGIGTNSVFQIIADKTNTIWMTSSSGIASVPLDEMNAVKNGRKKKVQAKFFRKDDGLQSGGITATSSGLCDSFGKLWFPLIDGYAVYDPLKANRNTAAPLVYIESMQFNGGSTSDFSRPVIIPAGTKRITISYSGLYFAFPEAVKFRYMLDGFDSGYSEPTTEHSVSFTNLPPAAYTFKIKAANENDVWTDVPAEAVCIQQPFFYQRAVFWIVCAGTCIMLIVCFIRLRYMQMLSTQKKLSRMVQAKTEALENERDNSNKLLCNILPQAIAERLKHSEQMTIADRFEEVSVLFADIVGFTEIAAKLSAEQIVSALNNLFSRFDIRAKKSGVEKIKTIGDSYMAVCGLPEANKNHAEVMIQFAAGLYEDLADYNKSAEIPFNLRIGINSGSVIAGVIGKTKFVYDLWGDTVNVASRMQSLCTPGYILVTEEVKERAQQHICFTDAVLCNVKGKGIMKTYNVQIGIQ